MQRARCRQRLFGAPKYAERLFWRFAELPWGWTLVSPYLPHLRFPRGPSTTFLDVGSGSRSWWLESLAEIGFNNLDAADPYITDEHINGVHYHRATLNEMEREYDVITLHHSLEHIPDQLGTLQSVAAHLTRDGIAMIRVPVFPNALWREYGEFWHGLDAPRHLYLHTKESIRFLAKAVGLRVIHSFCDMDENQFIASEQYRLGLPLFGPRSYADDRANCPIAIDQVSNWRTIATRLNAVGDAGQAAFILAHVE
jgi:hypothetical protein